MTFSIDPTQIVVELRRIADALDRLNPPIRPDYLELRKRGPDAIVRYGDDRQSWTRETFSNLIHKQGLAPAAEQELLDEILHEALEDPDAQT